MICNKNLVAFTGGGTGGHIYPGLAVAEQLKKTSIEQGQPLEIVWIGNSKGMDKKIIENAKGSDGNKIASSFYGIPSGKLRRYFSLKNFSDIFKIISAYFCARRILRKIKPAVLFSKGGFVSVPPCLAAKHLHIPVFTHECDFTLGLANRINFKSADKMFVSYQETKAKFSQALQKRILVTGNPVRDAFYNTDSKKGLDFLKIDDGQGSLEKKKPVLLVLGGSSGAKQINDLIVENLDWLCQNYIVVHQTGLVNSDESLSEKLKEKYGENYKPYSFIYEQMPDVVSAADVILSRAGANSIWEAAVLCKPMVLIPLCGSGTRGDQVDNAKFFEEKEAALLLLGDEATSENLKQALTKMLDSDYRKTMEEKLRNISGGQKPSEQIAEYIFNYIWSTE